MAPSALAAASSFLGGSGVRSCSFHCFSFLTCTLSPSTLVHVSAASCANALKAASTSASDPPSASQVHAVRRALVSSLDHAPCRSRALYLEMTTGLAVGAMSGAGAATTISLVPGGLIGGGAAC